ncbi:MAG TPA: hypothetical protein VLX58_00480, partial [Bryobacteraceae bacterium]|nr:hypothetical protein [Bryobacteraceae bacterium]
MVPENNDVVKTEELAELVREIRERVRARHPDAVDGAAPAGTADLMPLVHARDAAEAKVAAIGTVNPRPGGPLNALIQSVKRAVSRGLDWFVRDQVVFNREIMACVEATLEALVEVNRVLAGGPVQDLRAHWAVWHAEWERKLASNELQFLRSVADLQAAFQHRATMMEMNFRDIAKSQHADYLVALERATLEIQKRLWADEEKLWKDLDHIRTEYE